MNRLAMAFIFATAFCLTTISAFAQNVIYLDANYKLATAENYTFRRVFKYKEPILNPNIGTGYYGNITSNVQPTGLHYCTVTDYYRTGELALIGKVVAGDLACSQRGGFDGQVVAYYKDGNIKRREPWSSGKLNGVVVFYDEDGVEIKREEYANGKLIDESKFAAPADSPIIGTWKYVVYSGSGYEIGGIKVPPSVLRTATFIYSQNGVVESIHQNSLTTTRIKGNWKYIPKTSSSGILEEYQGEDLIERGTVKWLGLNQLEYTVTFSQNSDAIGNQSVWTRQ